MKQVETIEKISGPGSRRENTFQETRRKEIRDFWESGYQYASIETAGDVSLNRERQLYQKAMRQEKLPWHQMRLHQRYGRLFVERVAEHG